MPNPEVYISWCQGLADDPEALDILVKSGVVDGVELSNIDGQDDRIRDAGLKVSYHNPGFRQAWNLGRAWYWRMLEQPQGQAWIKRLQQSEAKTLGLHCGYTQGHPLLIEMTDPSRPEFPFQNNALLVMRVAKNIRRLEYAINSGLPEDQRKHIVLECHGQKAPEFVPGKEYPETIGFDDIIERYEGSAGLEGEPNQIGTAKDLMRVLGMVQGRTLTQIGLLMDIAHCLKQAYFNWQLYPEVDIHHLAHTRDMLWIGGGRTLQIHSNVPGFEEGKGYDDKHGTFKPGERMSDFTTEFTAGIVEETPELLTFALEMETDLEPQQHARLMADQAEYVRKYVLRQ